MAWFDYGVLAILGMSMLVGILRGLVREIVSLAGWIAALALAATFSGEVAHYMPESLGPLLGGLAGFLLIFVCVLLVSGFAGLILSLVARAAGMGIVDRLLGGLFGILRGVVIVLVLVLLVGLTPMPREPFWRQAVLSGPFETIVLASRPFLPAGLAQRLKYR